jgi:uncharacterized damage-inducible protein DinB
MELLPVFLEEIEHHYWARDSQLHACESLTVEQFLSPIGGSFSSVRDTFAHMVAVEWLWLERWRGTSPKALIPVEDFPTLAAVSNRWKAVEQELRGYLSNLNDSDLDHSLTCTSTRGEVWTYPQWRMIVHLLNHQSYHRGQVTNHLRMLGVQPPRGDFLVGLDAGFRIQDYRSL